MVFLIYLSLYTYGISLLLLLLLLLLLILHVRLFASPFFNFVFETFLGDGWGGG